MIAPPTSGRGDAAATVLRRSIESADQLGVAATLVVLAGLSRAVGDETVAWPQGWFVSVGVAGISGLPGAR